MTGPLWSVGAARGMWLDGGCCTYSKEHMSCGVDFERVLVCAVDVNFTFVFTWYSSSLSICYEEGGRERESR